MRRVITNTSLSSVNLLTILNENQTNNIKFASSSSSDSSDEEYLRKNDLKCSDFVVVCKTFHDQLFKSHFRMSRSSVVYLINEITKANVMANYAAGRKNVSNEKAVLMTIWYLANLETFRQISNRFDVARSTALLVIRKVITYFNTVSKEYIRWPNETVSKNISDNFRMKQGIGNVIGAIDGCHISIKKPREQAAYCNRKGYFSVVLQAVCDHKKRFIDVFCGEAGSVHDARVLRRSMLYTFANENGLPGDRFLLGDSAYPNLRWLVVPFRDTGNLTAVERKFNFKHSSTRIIIEHAFGLLKGKWRRLKHFDNREIHFIVECVIAACVLHNICINNEDDYDLDDFNEEYNDEVPIVNFEDQNVQDRRLNIINNLNL